MPPGKYYQRASAIDRIYQYHPALAGVPAVYVGNEGRDLSDYVSVSANNVSSNINFSLAPGSTISGYVYDALTRKPIEGAEIDAQNQGYLVFAKSKADGSYILSGMISGGYLVGCIKRDSNYIMQQYPEGVGVEVKINPDKDPPWFK